MLEAEAGNALRHRGQRAVQRMVEYAPSTGGLALWVQHADLPTDTPERPRTPPVFTDGHTVFYSAAFERLPLATQVGWVAHEVLHIALRHAQRHTALQQLLGDADLVLFNACADAIVNSTLEHLGWLQLPAGAVLLDRLLAATLGVSQPVEKSLLEWDVESLYRAIDDRRANPQGGRGRQPREGGSGSSAANTPRPSRADGPRAARVRSLAADSAPDLRPGDSSEAERPEDEAESAREWSERLTRAHAGDGEFSMLRTLLADLPRARTPWPQVLRVQLARALSKQPGPSWSRPSRSYLANQGRAGPHHRLPWEPGTSASRAVPRLVLVVDVSGSVEDELLERFAREVEAIVRRLEAGLVLVLGDDRVRAVTRFEPGRCALRDLAFHGGGGTDFTPLLEEADRHDPDITVVLTDLEGPARFRPRRPVLWAVPEPQRAVAPFGRVLGLR